VSRRALMGSVGSVGDFYNINTDSLLVPDQLNFHIREAYKYKTEPAQGNNTARCTIGRSTADLDRLFELLGVGAEQKVFYTFYIESCSNLDQNYDMIFRQASSLD
jgi:hypothetical protein